MNEQKKIPSAFQHYPVASKFQNTVFALLLAWPVIAVFGDGWHHHHLDMGMDALFNPFHLFLYIGVAVCGLYIIAMAYANVRKGYAIRKSLPHMYIRAAWGIALFVFAVACDLTWHHFFGFEESVDALLSPPHLLLAFSGSLVVSCLLRPIWHKERAKLVDTIVPALGFGYLFLILTFFVQYCHPYYATWLSDGVPVIGGVSYIQAAALAGSIVRTVLFCGLLFSTVKYFRFPKGTMFCILFAEAIGIGFMGGQFQYIFSAIIAGFLTELVYDMSYHRLHEHVRLRIFGFLIPVIFFIPYVFISLLYKPSWWSVHMIAGLIVVNGIVGWLMTYLIEPPKPHDYPTLR